MILIDNYDSFTYNIVQYLKELGIEPKVFKNDEITILELKKINFSSVIISPGPKTPDESGVSMAMIGEFYKTKKILGICLGHQCIAQYFGCKLIKAQGLNGGPMHGKVSKIYFEEDKLFNGLEQGFEATRYHSLIVDNESITDCIKPLAYIEAKMCKNMNDKWQNNSSMPLYFQSSSPLMALKHKDYPIYGVQFHPEAILTQGGKKLLKNFIML